MYLVLFSTALAEVLLLGADWLRQRRTLPADNYTTIAAAMLVCGAMLAAIDPLSSTPLHLFALVLVCWSAHVNYLGLMLALSGGMDPTQRRGIWLLVVVAMASVAFVLLSPSEQMNFARHLALLIATCTGLLLMLARCNQRQTTSDLLRLAALSGIPAAYGIGAMAAYLQGTTKPGWTAVGLATACAVTVVCSRVVAMAQRNVAWPESTAATDRALPDDFGQKERQWSADILLRYLIHETSQPLTAALANSQLMQMRLSAEAPNMDALAADVNRTLGSLVQIQALVRRLREQAAVSASSRQPCSVSLITGEVVSLLAYECRLQGVDLMFASANTDDYVLCDGVELRQIIWNLMRNALEAVNRQSNPGKAICCTVETQGTDVHLSVSDSGEGLPADVLHKLGSLQVAAGPGHFGIGLAIVKNLVTRNGGRIEAVNSPGAASADFSIIFRLTTKTEVQA